jgi:hypothetical protein
VKVLVVYVSRRPENYDHDRETAFGMKRTDALQTNLPGDYILFGRGFTGGGPRLPEEWRKTRSASWLGEE